LYGGDRGNGDALGDLWEWDGSSWTQVVGTLNDPGLRRAHVLACDPDRLRCVIFGGAIDRSGDLAQNDVWELHADPGEGPGLEIAFDWSTAGVDRALIQSIAGRLLVGGQAYLVGQPVVVIPGADVNLWNAQRSAWFNAGVIVSPPGSPGMTMFNVSDAVTARGIATGAGLIHMRAEPQVTTGAGIGSASTPAEVDVDVAELSATYQYPN
jgi:hypothetical protein